VQLRVPSLAVALLWVQVAQAYLLSVLRVGLQWVQQS
jgi:hypothetical protein